MKEKNKSKFTYKYKKYDYDLSRCPHCYSKMDRNCGVCTKCGFRESSIEGATNTLAKSAYKNFREEEVVLTKKLPPDVSYKKLILLVFTIGFMGAHLYYVGRYKKAIAYSVMFILALVTFVLFMLEISVNNGPLSLILMFVRIASGVYVLDLFCEFGRVVFKRFKVPVLAPENIAEYDRNNLARKEEN